MKCPNPVWIQDPATGGCMYVPCGKCTACRLAYSSAWSIRILHEAREWEKKCFVTLTYNDENLPSNKSLDKRALQLFLKRLRKNFTTPIKYFASGEYGEKNKRPHYHLILFGVSSSDRVVIERSWSLGFVSIGDFSLERARYVAGYAVKKMFNAGKDYYHARGLVPEFCLMSRRPGIGERWLKKHEELLRNAGVVRVQGRTYALPRYYRDKVYSEEDKVLLRALAEDFHAEAREAAMIKSGGLCDISLEEFLKAERIQNEKNLDARITKRRL